RPQPNAKGHIPTTMEWARKLTAKDIDVLRGQAPYSEVVPDVDEGFTQADLKDPKRAEAVYKVIRERLAKAQKERPFGYQVRHAPADDLKALQQLAGHLQAGLFITKFRKTFARDEMNDDLELVAARLGQNEDDSEYDEILPTSPPSFVTAIATKSLTSACFRRPASATMGRCANGRTKQPIAPGFGG